MRSVLKGAIGGAVAVVVALASQSADAGGWDTVHRFVHRTGNCGPGKEVMASMYSIGARTSSGEPMRHDTFTAASHDYPLGTSVTVVNPVNGPTCQIRINDRGSYGESREMGVKIDFAPVSMDGATHSLRHMVRDGALRPSSL